MTSQVNVDTIVAHSAGNVTVNDALDVNETLNVDGAVTAAVGITVTAGGVTVTAGGITLTAGTATFNDNVVLGSSAADTITANGTMVSNLIFTDATYDIGAAAATRPRDLHLSRNAIVGTSIELGHASDTTLTRSASGTVAVEGVDLMTEAAWDAQGDILVASAAGDAVSVNFPFGGAYVINGKISLAVAASALTVALKGLDGSDPSATNPVLVRVPQGNPFDGTYSIRKVTAALSVVVSSGSTLGQTDAVACPVYVYFIDNSGTLELAVSTHYFGDTSVASSTAEGGAGGADTATTLYSTTARTNVPCVILGRWKSTQTTAGTWAATTGEVQLYPFPYKVSSQQTFTGTGANTYTRPWDVLWLVTRVQAGGGGGGGSDNASVAFEMSVGGGGGGGGYAEERFAASAITATVTATVGAGGTAGAAAGGTTGGTGGTSSFGSYSSATGGVGGTGSGAGGDVEGDTNLGGGGGVGSSSSINASGGDGGSGFSCLTGTSAVGLAGNGGNSVLGGGGRGGVLKAATGVVAGAGGNVYGGGGGGAYSIDDATGAAGGAGAQGIIIVEEYYV